MENVVSKHKDKPKRFRDIWANQTDLGKKYGLSAVAVGNLLKAAGLKDRATGDATPRALDEGFAVATPLQDGKPFFMWNVEKIGGLIAADHEPLSKVDYWVREVEDSLAHAETLFSEGHDKVAFLIVDDLYAGVPKDVKAAVKAEIERRRPDFADDPPAASRAPVNDATLAPWED